MATILSRVLGVSHYDKDDGSTRCALLHHIGYCLARHVGSTRHALLQCRKVMLITFKHEFLCVGFYVLRLVDSK